MQTRIPLASGVGALVATLIVTTQVLAQAIPDKQLNSPWFADAQRVMTQRLERQTTGTARNVILFIGDGMGVSTLTAARILAGQQNGMPGEEGYLSFEHFPYTSLVKTYNVDAQTPDSAGTMTAIISGIKTDAGVIGVDEDVIRGECSTLAGNEVITALELAELKGMATGIVSTAHITHATPAATYAKSADRNWEDVSDMPEDAVAAGCEDIASQLINFEKNLEARFSEVDVDGMEVAFGGGRRHFLPRDAAANSADSASEIEGDRTDGRHLIDEWQALYPRGGYVFDAAGFNALDDSTLPVLGLFNESHMHYEADRGNDIAGEPSLTEMTQKAVELLKQDEDGFFLIVESGRIDHAHHAGNAYNALNDAIELSRAVKAAQDATDPANTLILVTADHGHVFTIAGYPKRGNPILGKVVAVGDSEPSLADDGMPYTTLGYSNGLGFRDPGAQTDADATGRQDLNSVDTQAPGFHQEALVPLGSETHAAEDVALHATGPGAFRVNGVIEQNVIFHVIDRALGLSAQTLVSSSAN